MRILFSVKNPDYVRHYVPVLRALASRGHRIELVKQSRRHAWPAYVVALAGETDRIRLSTLPELAGNPWWELATRFRQARLYLRRLADPQQGDGLLSRARKRAPPLAVRLAESLPLRPRSVRLLQRVVDALEQGTRSAAPYRAYLDAERPDVVVLTPLVVLKTTQIDLARAAVERGVRSIFAVASWDHLSSKGVLTVEPQRVFVWNEFQQREAVELHNVAAERVVITGAQIFDAWFGRTPSTSRETFCERLGLRADRPLVLYVCSSLLENSPPEAPFALEWARHLRQGDHRVLRECGIVIRPHPRRGREWRGADVTGLGEAICWPPAGELPVDRRSASDYFDSLYHADAVVGLNTSAMIEATILGRPVHTLLLPAFRDSQEGTVHFHYLLQGRESPLQCARSLSEHAALLARSLERPDGPARSQAFVGTFVRPHGLDVPATDVFVEAVEALARAAAPAPQRAPVWTHLLRPVLWPFAASAARRVRRLRDEHRSRKAAAMLAHRRRKAAAAVDNMSVR